jgi:hypothetical protein
VGLGDGRSMVVTVYIQVGHYILSHIMNSIQCCTRLPATSTHAVLSVDGPHLIVRMHCQDASLTEVRNHGFLTSEDAHDIHVTLTLGTSFVIASKNPENSMTTPFKQPKHFF